LRVIFLCGLLDEFYMLFCLIRRIHNH